MFLWFVVLAPVIVAEIFKSPKLDYRLVSFAAVFPILGSIPILPNIFHSFLFPTIVLVLVMLSTVGKRLRRRKLLAFPIGLYLHLILDFSWLSDKSLWWPFFGSDLDNLVTPELEDIPVKLALDLFSIAIGMWAWTRYKLNDPDNLKLYIRSGNLSYAVCKR